MTVHHTGHGVTLHHGDALDVLAELPDNSVDAVITDPPYSLTDRRDENCASDLLRDAIVGDAAHDIAHLAEQFVPLRVTCGRGGATMVRPVDLDAEGTIRDQEIHGDPAVVGQDNEPLMDMAHPVASQQGRSGDFRLWVRKGHARCVGPCRCLGESSDGRLRVPVRVRDDSARQAKGSAGVVAGPATELAAVLALDLAGGASELLPASGADVLDPAFEIRTSVDVGALARAGGFPAVLESGRVGEIGDPTGRAFAFDLLVHRSVLTSWRPSTLRGFMSSLWDGTGVETDVRLWRECLRVLRPGGHVLAFGGTRTWHRLACAIEDAGFQIRDNIAYARRGGDATEADLRPLAWMYGSGFPPPKSLDVGKAIDKAAGVERTEVVGVSRRHGGGIVGNGSSFEVSPDVPVLHAPATPEAAQWAGWGTALKPAHEPIVVARKPLTGTVANNVTTHGTGALNIDATRIQHQSEADLATSRAKNPGRDDLVTSDTYGAGRPQQSVSPAGRWPANVVLDDAAAAELDQQSGERPGGSYPGNSQKGPKFNGDTYNAGKPYQGTVDEPARSMGDSGGASRFFYTAKADATERPRVAGVSHATVKPLDLMRWLVRLVTPPGGTVLEPFAGSGTTVEAALLEGMRCIAIEREADYLPLILSRVHRQRDPVAFVKLAGDPAELTLFDEEPPA